MLPETRGEEKKTTQTEEQNFHSARLAHSAADKKEKGAATTPQRTQQRRGKGKELRGGSDFG